MIEGKRWNEKGERERSVMIKGDRWIRERGERDDEREG